MNGNSAVNHFSETLKAYYVHSQGNVDAVFNRLVRDHKGEEIVELARAIFQNQDQWLGLEPLKNRTIQLKVGDNQVKSMGALKLLAKCDALADRVRKGSVDLSKDDTMVNLGIPELDEPTLRNLSDCQKGLRSIWTFPIEDVLKLAIVTKVLGITHFNHDLRRYLSFFLSSPKFTESELHSLRQIFAHLLQQWEGDVLGSPKLKEVLEKPLKELLERLIWSSLPRELLYTIAEHLPKEKLKGMPNEVIVHQLNQRKIVLHDLFSTVDEAIQFASRHGLKVIDLSYFKVTNDHISQLLKTCPQVEVLRANLQKVTLVGLEGSFVNLRELRLDVSYNISEQTVQELLLHSPNVVVLNLSFCKNITINSIQFLAQHFPNLIQLGLGHGPMIDDLAVEQLVKLTKLEKLYLGKTDITDSGAKNLAEKLIRLNCVDLVSCQNITDIGFQHIAENLKNLTILDISYCSGITVASDLRITEHLTKLTSLSIGGNYVTDLVMENITKRLTNLKFLDLSCCSELTNQGLRHVGERLINLTDLTLDNCPKLSDHGFGTMVHLAKLSKLKLIDLNINTQTFALIAENLKNLTSIQLSSCSLLTDLTLKYLVENLSKLEEIVIRGQCDVTKETVTELRQRFPNVNIKW